MIEQGIYDFKFQIEKIRVRHKGDKGSTLAHEGEIGRGGLSGSHYTINFGSYFGAVVELAQRNQACPR